MKSNTQMDWRCLNERQIEDIINGEAESWLKEWFNYHISKEGHDCKVCQNKYEELQNPSKN